MRKLLVVGVTLVVLFFAVPRGEADAWGTIQIQYVSWNGDQWSAVIQNIVRQAT